MTRNNGHSAQQNGAAASGLPLALPARASEPVDYLSALFDRTEARVPLPSGELVLQRLGLGRHFQLQNLGQEIKDTPLRDRVGRFRAWLQAAGVENPDALELADLVGVVQAIKSLNTPRGRLAWDAQPAKPGEARGPKTTDYPGRQLARVVDILARHYGWSLDEILELPPELALAHMQECILADRRAKEWNHQWLSEVAWEYDKASGMRRYKPLPPIPWETPAQRRYEPLPEWVVEKYYPKGVIIDLADSDSIQSAAEDGKEGGADGPRE